MASSSGVSPSPGSSSIMTDILAHLPYPCLVDPSVELDRIDRGSHRAHPRPMAAPTPIRPGPPLPRFRLRVLAATLGCVGAQETGHALHRGQVAVFRHEPRRRPRPFDTPIKRQLTVGFGVPVGGVRHVKYAV